MVVKGIAIIIPTMPNSEPHTERDKRMIAGFRPIAFPIIFGTKNRSIIHCTITYIRATNPSITQKLSSVCDARNQQSNIAGGNVMTWRYGIICTRPTKRPNIIAIGKPMIWNPVAYSTARMQQINAWWRKYLFMLVSTSSVIRPTIGGYLGGIRNLQSSFILS